MGYQYDREVKEELDGIDRGVRCYGEGGPLGRGQGK